MSDGDQDAHASNLAGLYQRGAAVSAGAALGIGIPGPAGPVVGAAAGVLLEPLAEKMWDKLRSDSQQRQAEALAAAQEALGVDPAELEQRIWSSDGSRLQAGIALSAVSRTTWPPKVVALGRALAAGLMATDDTLIDRQPFIMAALVDIEFPQGSLLELLERYWPREDKYGVRAELFIPTPDTPWSTGQRVWRPSDITLVRPTLRPILPSLLGTLQRHGLITQSANTRDPFGFTSRVMQRWFRSGGPTPPREIEGIGAAADYAPPGSWLPSELGEEVLKTLLEAGAEFTA